MKADWIDPDDVRPNATHKPREICGWRTYCPLRRMARIAGSQITMEHIAAADMLRRVADHALLGFSSHEAMLVHIQGGFGSRIPSMGAVAQARALGELARVLRLFRPSQMRMIGAVILRNRSVHGWCNDEARRTGTKPDQKIETGRLLAILEVLWSHYDGEIALEKTKGVNVA